MEDRIENRNMEKRIDYIKMEEIIINYIKKKERIDYRDGRKNRK